MSKKYSSAISIVLDDSTIAINKEGRIIIIFKYDSRVIITSPFDEKRISENEPLILFISKKREPEENTAKFYEVVFKMLKKKKSSKFYKQKVSDHFKLIEDEIPIERGSTEYLNIELAALEVINKLLSLFV